jgi:hypothetical protein
MKTILLGFVSEGTMVGYYFSTSNMLKNEINISSPGGWLLLDGGVILWDDCGEQCTLVLSGYYLSTEIRKWAWISIAEIRLSYLVCY